MINLSGKRQQQIVDVLRAKGWKCCSACDGINFSVLDGYFNQKVHPKCKQYYCEKTGDWLSCAVIICDNCGYVREHVLAILGLNSDEDEDDDG